MDVGELQRKLSQRASGDPHHRFEDLYALLTHADWLEAAYHRMKHNTGAETPGVDGMTRTPFEANLEGNLEALRQALKTGAYRPLPVRRVTIEEQKADGRIKERRLGIPAFRDRIIQEGLRMILEPIYEADFSRHSYGFRPNRSTKDAVAYLATRLTQRRCYRWAIEGDIRACFDSIRHNKLLGLLRRRIRDVKLLHLIRGFLRAGCLEGLNYRPTLAGTPQGGIVSPILANLYLHELDRFMAQYTELEGTQRHKRKQQGLANFLYARYADDFVVLCDGTKSQAEEMRRKLAQFLMTTLKLELSMEKTRITHVSRGFIFLGFQIECTRGAGGTTVPKLRIPEAALRRIRHKIDQVLAPSTCQDSVRAKIIALNRIIRGWCEYYRTTSSPSVYFRRLNNRVFWKMAHWLGRKFKVSIPRVMRRFRQQNSFGTTKVRLRMPAEFTAKRYRLRRIPNPYTSTPTDLQREVGFSLQETWSGAETRHGNADLREQVYDRDGGRCGWCGRDVSWNDYHMDHIKPRHRFKRPAEANALENLQVLHKHPCHDAKTKADLRAVAV